MKMHPIAEVDKFMRDILSDRSSVLQEDGFQDAWMSAPEEIKARLVANRVAIESALRDPGPIPPEQDFIGGLIRELGGDTRKKTLASYDGHDYGEYWFDDGFGRIDEKIIREEVKVIAANQHKQPGELRAIDVGAGGRARIMCMFANIINQLDPDNAENFRKTGVKGFDFAPEAVIGAKKEMLKKGIPTMAVFEADFLSIVETLLKLGIPLGLDAATAMMHTPWHAQTEKDKITFLKNMESILVVGGRLIFDTVLITSHETELQERKEAKKLPDNPLVLLEDEDEFRKVFSGLLSLYDILKRKYTEDMQPVVNNIYSKWVQSEGGIFHMPKLIESPRHFISDSTAGVEGCSFTREVSTAQWVSGLCKAENIKLREVRHVTSKNAITCEETLHNMGKQWLEQSNLTDWLKAKIKKRLDLQDSDLVDSGNWSSIVDKFYNHIALYIAKRYMNRYLVYERIQ